MHVLLRAVTDDDLPIFFDHMQDADARHMAAFLGGVSSDREAYLSHWRERIVPDETAVARTVIVGDHLAGHVESFLRDGLREVSYWIRRDLWGQGIATAALRALLEEITERPIYGRAAADNRGSIGVLENCGFTLLSRGRGFANGRQAEIEEVLMVLE